MLTLETIITVIAAAAPSIVSIIGVIVSVIKMIRESKISNKEVIDKFEETRQAVMDSKQYDELKAQLEISHAENRELKKKLNELLTKIDRIAREEE